MKIVELERREIRKRSVRRERKGKRRKTKSEFLFSELYTTRTLFGLPFVKACEGREREEQSCDMIR